MRGAAAAVLCAVVHGAGAVGDGDRRAAGLGASVVDYVNPQNWQSSAPACGNKYQSPIDIRTCGVYQAGTKKTMSMVQNYAAQSGMKLWNSGHGLKVKAPTGGSYTLGNVTFNFPHTMTYDLDPNGFHFHCPSEHSIDGELFPCELHMVHQMTGATGLNDLLVVGILFKKGAVNAFLSGLGWTGSAGLPAYDQTTAISGSIDLAGAFATQFAGDFYRYDGSLTTPPCTESVKWFVMATPAEMSEAQINEFKALYPDPANNRPVQPQNGRGLISGAYSADSEVVMHGDCDEHFYQKWNGWALYLCVALPLFVACLVMIGILLVRSPAWAAATAASAAEPELPVPSAQLKAKDAETKPY